MPRYVRPLSAAVIIKAPKISFHLIATVLIVTPSLIASSNVFLFFFFLRETKFLSSFMPVGERYLQSERDVRGKLTSRTY